MQIYTDGSNVDEKVAAAAVLSVDPNSPFSCRLRDHCFIYNSVCSKTSLPVKRKEIHDFLSDSLSALQVFKNLKTDHPLLIQVQKFYTKLMQTKRKLFL